MLRRPASLRSQLVLVLVGAVAFVWSAALVFVYFDSRKEVGEMLDAHLAQSAAMLLARGEHGLGELDIEHAPQLHRYARKVVFQVWQGGTLLKLHSQNAPQSRLSPQDEGFSDARIDDKRWRVFSAWSEQRRYLVQVAERYGARDEIAESMGEHLVVPMLVALPILAAAIWIAVSRALRPIRELSRQVLERDPARLDPVSAHDVPIEIEPLVSSLDRLFQRVGAMIEKERRFTADAAHELRTPLAALRAQAQVARLPDTGDEARLRALDQVLQGCDRATRLVEQLLVLARVDQGARPPRSVAVDLRDVAGQAVAELAPTAVVKDVELELVEESPVRVAGDAALLGILVRNLVDNAVRYGPAGSRVTVRIATREGRPTLTVEDQGPGIPPAERERVWERFYRIAGTEAPGSGLGMSIVRRIAELHGASATLKQADGRDGLHVSIRFPAAGRAAEP